MEGASVSHLHSEEPSGELHFNASLANRNIALDFLNFALADLQRDCLVLSFLPLPSEMHANLPAHVLAPPPNGKLLNTAEVRRAVSRCQIIVGVCIVGDESEKEAARHILNQFRNFRSLQIIVVLLMPSGKEPTPEDMDAIMMQHDDLISMGASHVLIQPELSPGNLQDSVGVICKTHDHTVAHMKRMLAGLPPQVSPKQIKACIKEEQALLWTTIPAVLMPEFPRVDPQLHETDAAIGQYSFQREHQCNAGRVVAATNEDEVNVAVKIITKSSVHSAAELENIYRECKFSRSTAHPNLARCLEVLHTRKNLHLVYQDAGDNSLEEYCALQQHQRLDEDSAMGCLAQIGEALRWMHQNNFSHRAVSLHHVVVKQQDRLHFTLVDFRYTIVAREDTRSNVVCGNLPCIAPEVAFGEGYIPRHADSWSLGVVLLEIAGGLTSLIRNAEPLMQERRHDPRLGDVTYDEMCQGLQHLNLVERGLQGAWNSLPRVSAHEDPTLYFEGIIASLEEVPDAHAVALGVLGGVNSPRVIFYLERLLVLIPEVRMSMQVLVQTLNGGA